MKEIIQRYFDNELTPAEKKELFASLEQDAELKKEFIEMQNVRALSSLLSSDRDPISAAAPLAGFRKRRQILFYRKTFSYAAAVMLVLFAVKGLIQPVIPSLPEEPAVYMMEVSSHNDRTTSFKLSDGTVVWLNANSVLRYPNKFSGDERRVELIGEAFFEVARDEAHPFLVITNQYDIQVLGTRFNVFAYEGQDVKTSLVEGSVKTFMKDDASVSASLVPNESVEMKDGEFVKGSFSRSDFLSWKEGIYSFDDVPFSEIVSRLELYFGIPIVINNDNLASYRFSGKFRQDDGLESILKTMKKIYRFNMEKDRSNDSIVIE